MSLQSLSVPATSTVKGKTPPVPAYNKMEFPYFKQLPPELQMMIWERAATPPQCIHFLLFLRKPKTDEEAERLATVSADAGLWMACRMSRWIMDKAHSAALNDCRTDDLRWPGMFRPCLAFWVLNMRLGGDGRGSSGDGIYSRYTPLQTLRIRSDEFAYRCVEEIPPHIEKIRTVLDHITLQLFHFCMVANFASRKATEVLEPLVHPTSGQLPKRFALVNQFWASNSIDKIYLPLTKLLEEFKTAHW